MRLCRTTPTTLISWPGGFLVSLPAQLLGSRQVTQLINQAHYKLAGDGLEFPWHQDSAHRRYGGEAWSDVNGRGSYVQTVLAVDPAYSDNGPLYLIPGSSRMGHRVPASAPNHSTRPRRVLINGYASPGSNARGAA